MEKIPSRAKVLIVGDSATGKTSIMNQATMNIFDRRYEKTIGIDFRITKWDEGKELVTLQIWDTAGQKLYRPADMNYFHKSDAVVVVYDITNRESFEEVDKHFNDIEKLIPYVETIVLCGNKSDLEDDRQVSYDEGKQLAEFYGIPMFFETSAKDDANISSLFTFISNSYLESKRNFLSDQMSLKN
ncbi:unnamed protein product [Moneuplotes crassus]|uniref:Uncharacterized protein n=1 Tax=Euplotes crassus TaxID=5936 RepID=A0AAD2D5D3_EUPCR|nr:unnamed protein product [Moneuplotes crassus]